MRFALEEIAVNVQTVKRYLLERTTVFPWQFQQVRRALADAGLRVSTRPIVYRFPEDLRAALDEFEAITAKS